MEIPDGAVISAAIALAGSVIGGVRISWAYITKQFEAKDARIASLEDQLVAAKENGAAALVAKTKECAAELKQTVREMTDVYVESVGESASMSRSLLQSNMSTSQELAQNIRILADEVRRQGNGGRGETTS